MCGVSSASAPTAAGLPPTSAVGSSRQPETFTFATVDGRLTRYTPDFQVWRIDGRIEIHEVTVEARRQAHGMLPPREVAAQALCQARGWHYLVHTDQTLPSGYAYANLDTLSAFRSASYADPRGTIWLPAAPMGQEARQL